MSDSAMMADPSDSRAVDRTKTGATRRRDEPRKEDHANIFQRIVRFIRQTIGELKKVRYPTREELWQYFLVVIAFVAVLMAFTGVVDQIFAKITTLVFV